MKIQIPKLSLSKEQLQWVILGVLGGILLVILGGMFLIVPGFEKKRQLVNEYLEKNEKLKQDERMIGKKDKLQASLDQLKKKRAEMDETILKLSGKFSMLTILSEKSQECGIIFEKIEPKDLPEAERTVIKGYTQKDYFLRFHANYHQIGEFVAKLETSTPFIDVQDVRISGVPETPASHDATVAVRCLVEI